MVVEIVYTDDQRYSYANIAVVGQPKTGKTRFLGTVPQDEMIVLNIISESGMMTLGDQKIATIPIGKKDASGKTDYLKDMREAIAWIKENGQKFNYLAIDSFSQLQKRLVQEVPFESKYDRWTNIKNEVRAIVDEIKRLPMHTICTFELEKDKDEESKAFVYHAGVEGKKIQDEVFHWYDFIFFFDKIQDGDQLIYRCLTEGTSKIPAGGRKNSKIKIPAIIVNPNLKEITTQMFGKVNKEEQKKEMAEVVAETKSEIKTLLTQLGTKVNMKIFKETYEIKCKEEDIETVVNAMPLAQETAALIKLKEFSEGL